MPVDVRREAFFLFAIFFVFFEFSFCLQKQFLKHLPLAGIGGDLEHCLEMPNVLSSDKTLHRRLRWAAAPRSFALDSNALLCALNDYFPMEMVWQPIATAPANDELELSLR